MAGSSDRPRALSQPLATDRGAAPDDPVTLCDASAFPRYRHEQILPPRMERIVRTLRLMSESGERRQRVTAGCRTESRVTADRKGPSRASLAVAATYR